MTSSAQFSVASTAVEIVSVYGENRLVIIHSGGHPAYLGDSTVTSSTGLKVEKDTDEQIWVPKGSSIYAISANANISTVSVLYLRP